MSHFTNYIGQENFVRIGNQICNVLASGKRLPLPSIAFTGFAGLGKTEAANRLYRAIHTIDNDWKFVEIPADITPSNFKQTLMKHNHKKVMYFIDEAHNIRKIVINMLKPILETGKQVKEFHHEDFCFTANPFETLWVFASNECLKDTALFGPTGRTTPVLFTPYKREDCKQLVELKSKRWNITYTEAALDFLLDRVLPNGRAIGTLVDDQIMMTFLDNKHVVMDDAKTIVKEYKRFPKGLLYNDVRLLKFIGSESNGKQVNECAQHLDGEPLQDTQYRIQWLSGFNFVTTKQGKKVLTREGLQYLESLVVTKKKATTSTAVTTQELVNA